MTEILSHHPETDDFDHSPVHLVLYALTHIRSMACMIPLVMDIHHSVKFGTPRSLYADLERLNNIYNTPIIREGLDYIPSSGGVIFAISHVTATNHFPGWKDPQANPIWPLMAITQAVNLMRHKQEITLIAVDPVEALPQIRKLSTKALKEVYTGIPINKIDPKKAKVSLNLAIQKLNQGSSLVISPEGQDGTTMHPIKRGISKLAIHGHPVIPVGFNEEYNSRYQTYTHTIRFGPPLFFPQMNREGEKYQRRAEKAFAHQVEVAIAQLLPVEMRGYYTPKP